MKPTPDRSTRRFILPIVADCIFGTSMSLVFSSIVSSISASSLAAVGIIYSIQNVLQSLLAFVTVGAPVLVARFVGEGSRKRASAAVEQAIFLSFAVGISGVLICELTAEPLLRLLMPSVAEDSFRESLTFYRELLISFPLLIVFTVLSAVIRAAGDSRRPLIGSILLNLALTGTVFVAIRVFNMGVSGAALAYSLARLCGASFLLLTVLRYRGKFRVRPSRIFIPKPDLLRRMLRLGFPVTLENTSVQAAYLLASSLAMGLAAPQPTIYTLVNTVVAFPCLPMNIGSAAVVTLVGQRLGAKDFQGAKRSQRSVLLWSLSISTLLAVVLCLFGPFAAGLYTKDPAVQKESANLFWMMIAYVVFAVCINIDDPVLRTAGDTKYVMWYTIFSIWLVRIPITWLFCYVFDMGAMGVHLANIIALGLRSAFGLLRLKKGKWVYLKV